MAGPFGGAGARSRDSHELVWHAAEMLLRRVALTFPTAAPLQAAQIIKRHRFNSDLLHAVAGIRQHCVLRRRLRRAAGHKAISRFEHGSSGYGQAAMWTPTTGARSISTSRTTSKKNSSDSSPDGGNSSTVGSGASGGSRLPHPHQFDTYFMAQANKSFPSPPEGWSPPALEGAGGAAGTHPHAITSVRDLLAAYPWLEAPLLSAQQSLRAHDSSGFRAALIALLVLSLVLLVAFGKEIRQQVTQNTGDVAADVLSHAELQIRASDLAKAVINEVITDKDIHDKVALFVQDLLADQYVRQSVAELLVWSLKSESVRESMYWLLAHPETQDSTAKLMYDVLQSPNVKEASAELAQWVVTQPHTYQVTQDMFQSLFSSQPLLDQGTKFMTYAAWESMADPSIVDQCARLMEGVLGDPRVQKRGGDAVWGAMTWMLNPLNLVRDADRAAQEAAVAKYGLLAAEASVQGSSQPDDPAAVVQAGGSAAPRGGDSAPAPPPGPVQARAELLMDPAAASSVPAPAPKRGLAIADVDDDEEGGGGEDGWGEAR